jgi:hypothetical protein
MGPRISVAVVTFNGARFLEAQLTSIADQRPAPYEVVIADDGSSDGTQDIIASALAGSPFPVRMIGGDHVGLRANVERAISACEGSVIALSDQDDIWMPGRLDAIGRAFEDPSVTLWFSDAELIDEHDVGLGARLWEKVHLSPDAVQAIASGEGVRRLLHGSTVTGATMAFRGSVGSLAIPFPAELEGPDHLFLHDGWIAAMAALTGRVAIDERTLTGYRQHSEQFTAMYIAQSSTPATAGRAPASRRDIADEHARVALVLARLVERSEFDALTPERQRLLTELEELLRHRAAERGPARTSAILSQLRGGRYERYARGWRTALADLLYRRQ